MEFVELTALLDNSLHQIDQLLPTRKEKLTKCLQNYYMVVQQKSVENAVISDELKQKADLLQQKENSIRQELEALHQHYTSEINFKDEIIVRNSLLIIQQKERYDEISTHERNVFQSQIALKQKQFNNNKEQNYKQVITKLTQQLENNRTTHAAAERQKRENWNTMKQKLDEILLEYDSKMLDLQNQLEGTNEIYENTKKELEQYKVECTSQDTTYQELMKEKEQYLENLRQQKLNEIRVKMAKRTIVKFIEQYYPVWKKKKLKTMKKKSKYKYKR